jgi:hypothetical protein
MDSTENQPPPAPAEPGPGEPPGPAQTPAPVPPPVAAQGPVPVWNPSLGPQEPGDAPGTWMAPAPVEQRSKVLIWSVVAVAVLALGCLGTVGWGIVRIADNVRSAATTPPRPVVPLVPSGAASPDPAGTLDGPQASSYAVREADDLQRLCEGWYYPQSPTITTTGLNPVQVFANERKDLPSMIQEAVTGVPYTASKAVRDAYDPASPAKVRQVACVNLVSTGKHVRSCTFNDPKPEKIPLEQGFYQFTLYEVATGKKLVDKKITGEDDSCPFVVLLGSDRTIYSSIGDRQLYELLHKYVQK